VLTFVLIPALTERSRGLQGGKVILQDRVALVTGAGSGIGRAVCESYAREGARVVAADLNEAAGRETADTLTSAGAGCHFVQADVSDPAACEAIVSAALEQYGRLDVACNNAGINRGFEPAANYALDDWHEVIQVNLSAVFYCIRAQVPAMLESGGGSIVNIASILGAVGLGGVPAYVASKHGVVGLTKSVSLDYAAQGIRVNAVGPGFIETPLIERRTDDPEKREELERRHPIGRIGQASEVAELVTWLSSERASFVTGSFYPVDGGYASR
jgi:NAD(P)-dependent dehydrogenase (short-subunit alcohol dehydrogenase family)